MMVVIMTFRIVFFGTSDFSLPSLQALINDPRFEIVAVITKPDMKVGRHQETVEPPVKKIAKKHKIPVYQFEKIKTEETFENLRNLQTEKDVDAFVVVSYGKIIPQRILDLPKHGAINVHGSLLPLYRGASCVQAAIAAGDKKSGVTIMLIDAEMDHGPILAQKEIAIRPDDTGRTLHDRLADVGAVLLPNVLADYMEGKITPQEQDHSKATYCKILKRGDGKIDWSKSAEEIERLVRAYDSWPGTFTILKNKRIKILNTLTTHKAPPPLRDPATCIQIETGQLTTPDKSGVWFIEDGKLLVNCGGGTVLEILKLQPEGGKALTAKEFLSGYRSFVE